MDSIREALKKKLKSRTVFQAGETKGKNLGEDAREGLPRRVTYPSR